jgi:cephalosporin hydroxylase
MDEMIIIINREISNPCLVAGVYVILCGTGVNDVYPMPETSINHPSHQIEVYPISQTSMWDGL